MAVTQKETVIRIDADNDTVAGILNICGIRYMPGTSASIKADASSSGMVLWETLATTEFFDNVEIRVKDGIWVDLAGAGAVLYLYLETE